MCKLDQNITLTKTTSKEIIPQDLRLSTDFPIVMPNLIHTKLQLLKRLLVLDSHKFTVAQTTSGAPPTALNAPLTPTAPPARA